MKENELLSAFFLLGKSPKDLDFLEEDWEDEYQDDANLRWDQFLKLHAQGLWRLNDEAIEMFSASFRSFNGFEKVKETYESISADSEDWNDFLEYLIYADDFDELWSESWLTRYDMDSALANFSSKTEDSATKIRALKEQFHLWFDSDEKSAFRKKLVQMLNPLKLAIENISIK